jgi:transposase-like protein
MPTKRRYSDEERANALAALAANGGNVNRTASQLRIPAKTLENWQKGSCHPEAAENGERKKGPMADALEAVAWKLLDSIPEKIARAPLNQTATALGIALDKARLLRGEPTNITQDLAGLSDDELDRRIADVEGRIAAAQAGAAAPAVDGHAG